MQCVNPVRIWKNLQPSEYPDGLLVPCGKCIACRIKKRKEWSMRMLHESTYWEKSCFITLTYNDENMPENSSLKITDLQKFFKRLRKSTAPNKLKYYACGEYGFREHYYDTTGKFQTGTERPHYHAIIFGVNIDEDYLIEDNWKFGFSTVGLCEPYSIQYVAQYIDKKLTGPLAQKEYNQKGREPVFRILSQGIGKRFVNENSEQLIENEEITMWGISQSFPRYYINQLGLEKSEFRKDRAILADQKTVERLTGISDINSNLYCEIVTDEELRSFLRKLDNERLQREKNLYSKVNLRQKNKS